MGKAMEQQQYNNLINTKESASWALRGAWVWIVVAGLMGIGTQYVSISYTFSFYDATVVALIVALAIPFFSNFIISLLTEKNDHKKKKITGVSRAGLFLSLACISSFNIYTMVAEEDKRRNAQLGEITDDISYKDNKTSLVTARKNLERNQANLQSLKSNEHYLNKELADALKTANDTFKFRFGNCNRYSKKSRKGRCKMSEEKIASQEKAKIMQMHERQITTNNKERETLLSIIKDQNKKISELEKQGKKVVETIKNNRKSDSFINMINPHNIAFGLLVDLISTLSFFILFSKLRHANQLKIKINQVNHQIIITPSSRRDQLELNKSVQEWEDEILSKMEQGTWDVLTQRGIVTKTAKTIKQGRAKMILEKAETFGWVESYIKHNKKYYRYPRAVLPSNVTKIGAAA